ncbi:hypothetical protein KKF17_03265, partial [Patescibacteria group bacterium]|nr:hypothetical protein [Patescibacteria group bacterium]
MKSLYLFFGDEEYLIKSKLRSLKEKHKNASLETYDHNTTAEVLAETLRMSSLFAPERLIIVEDINLARSEWLLEVMPDLSPGTTLVLLPEQVDRRNKVFKYFSKHGEIFEARAYAPWQQEEAAEVILKEANISRPAARL